MKKTIKINDLCCQRCADQMAVKLALVEGVRSAKANYKKGLVFVEVADGVLDETLTAVFEAAGMEVLSIEKRKGIFS